MVIQFPWQPEWNFDNSLVLSRTESIFGMEVPWDNRHQLRAMVTSLPWQPKWNFNNSFVLKENCNVDFIWKAFKMLENDTNITEIGQAVLDLLSFKVGSGNHQRGLSLLQKFSDIFGNMARSTENGVTSDKSQFSNIKNWNIFQAL